MCVGSEPFKIDTKGSCLLCLKRMEETSTSVATMEGLTTPPLGDYQTAFRLMTRYLKIDILKLANFTSRHLEEDVGVGGTVPLVVSLCGDCSGLIREFGKLLDDLDSIRLALDMRTVVLREVVQKADMDGGRVDEFKRMMVTRNPMDLFHLSVAENFRKETVEKCGSKLNSGLPKVRLRKERVTKNNSAATSPRPSTSRDARLALVESSVDNFDSLVDTLNIEEVTWSSVSSDKENGEPVDVEIDVLCKLEVETEEDGSERSYEPPDDSRTLRQANEASDFDSMLGDDTTEPLISEHFLLRSGMEESGEGEQEGDDQGSEYLGGRDKEVRRKVRSSLPNRKSKAPKMSTYLRCGHVAKYRCKYCKKAFIRKPEHTGHVLSEHTLEHYSKYLPKTVTQEKMDMVVDFLVGKQRVAYDGKNERVMIGCSVRDCKKVFTHVRSLRLHLIRDHFEEIRDLLRKSKKKWR